MNAGLLVYRNVVEVPCTIEVERTRETLHAHVMLQDFEGNEGDKVTVQSAPTRIAFGERVDVTSTAIVARATAVERLLTRLFSYFELTELYEVGFQPKE